jgi:DMSO/TMAO reductase YedYZ heme-binding membrane subunit
VPLTNQLSLNMPSALLVLMAILVPIVPISRGMICLALPELETSFPYAIRLGAIAVICLLMLAPLSARWAWLNRELNPIWQFLWLLGVAVLLTYIFLMLRRQQRNVSAT